MMSSGKEDSHHDTSSLQFQITFARSRAKPFPKEQVMKNYTVAMRVSTGDMGPSSMEFLISGVSLRKAIKAIQNDVDDPNSFFVPYEEKGLRSKSFRDYYICEGTIQDTDEPYRFVMPRRRVLLHRGGWLKTNFPLPSEWEWRKPLW